MKHLIRLPDLGLLLWLNFLDTLALSIFFGTSIPLLLATHNIFNIDHHRDLVYGSILAILPIGQFFLGPIWGQLSDQYGRKVILKITLLISMIGFILMAIAIDERFFWLFVWGRAISAGTAVNGAISQASMADLSAGIQKTKRFNLQFIMVSLGFITGPYFIDFTGSNAHSSHIYWFIATCYGVTTLLFHYQFNETLTLLNKQKIKWLRNLQQIFLLFKSSRLREILLVWSFFQIGWSLFFQFSGEFLFSARHLSNETINQLFSWIGLGIVICQFFLVYPLSNKLKPANMVPLSMIVIGVSLFLGGIVPPGIAFYLSLAGYCVGISFFLTNFNSYISNQATDNEQGRLMTILMAIQAGMTIVSTLAGNFLVIYYLATPYVIGGALILLSIGFWPFNKKITD